ncbi:MAG: dienelactone hydrolase family protein [Isosphaeraceae bacterium]
MHPSIDSSSRLAGLSCRLLIPALVLGAVSAGSPSTSIAADVPKAAASPLPAVVESKVVYESQGKTIRVERFEPPGDAVCPAVLILHGSGGMAVGGPSFREMARTLARNGYVADVVHYFDLTGTVIADMPTMRAKFPVWLLAVADGVTNLSKHPRVDPKRLGLCGYSLGAYLSLSASVFDDRVCVVVDFFGGLPPEIRGDVRSLPPTLILHGELDRIVPVSEAKVLVKMLEEKAVPHELKLYSGQGHMFYGEDLKDANRRALAFLDAHLSRPPVKRHQVARPNFDLYLPSAKPAVPVNAK